MARALVLALACFTSMGGAAWAIPAKPLHEPAAPPKLPPPVFHQLNGTVWQGKYLTLARVFIFEPDGTLTYKPSAASTLIYKNRGHWRLEGNRLFFEYFTNPNVKLMQYHGVLTNPNTIQGEQLILRTGQRIPTNMTRTGAIAPKKNKK